MNVKNCTGCGECCRKGGPLLHLEDVPLVAQGHIPLTALVTLRVGELARDDVAGLLAPLEEEAVKLAGTGEKGMPWHCVFHCADKACAVYAYRPAQCRALYCTDTAELERLYATPRAQRRHILPHALPGWLELAEAHEEQCPLYPLVPLAAHIDASAGWCGDDMEAARPILESVRYDLAFRELSVQKAAIPEAALSCVLGRPITVFLRSLGLEVAGRDTLQVRRTGNSHHQGSL